MSTERAEEEERWGRGRGMEKDQAAAGRMGRGKKEGKIGGDAASKGGGKKPHIHVGESEQSAAALYSGRRGRRSSLLDFKAQAIATPTATRPIPTPPACVGTKASKKIPSPQWMMNIHGKAQLI